MANTIDSNGIKDIVAKLEAHEAFMMTPQGKAWKKIADQTVDYLDIIPTAPLNFHPNAITDLLKGGFKHGELSIIAAIPTRYDEPRTAFTTTLAMQHMLRGAGTFMINLERTAEDVERSYQKLFRGKPRADSEGAFNATSVTHGSQLVDAD